ncbi:MAG TPA: sigma-70 family RNA polymerase sigma factor [Jatrophihabitantaceae bacterium]|nr:sigma-70 family RNA polymerase sigma factor [Jatrophihabitantaceae bacterium]
MSIDNEEFSRMVEPYRRELLAHCYRMLGSVHEAEDAVQEALLRAWRSYDGFEGRSSLRTWLYRIATNASLRAIEQRGRRPLPSDLGGPSQDPAYSLAPSRTDIAWLEPVPDRLVSPDPAAVVGLRGSIRLAFVATLQHLPPRQRAVLILREVIGLPAAEVADLLDTSTAAINSSLQRARAALLEAAPAEETTTEPVEADTRALLDRYVAAFENADVAELQRVLLETVALEMPPTPTWFSGRDVVTGFLSSRVLRSPGQLRLIPTRANGQPAVAEYGIVDGGVYEARAIHVLEVTDSQVSRIVVFFDTELFPLFDLPATLPAATAPARDQRA